MLIAFSGECGHYVLPGERDAFGRRIQGEIDLGDCDLMRKEVWTAEVVTRAAEHFWPVLLDRSDETLITRYRVVSTPTTLIVDPWGNEILRVVGHLEAAKMVRILEAVPRDFTALAPFAKALRDDGSDPKALIGAAAFYEKQNLRQVSDRLYGRALAAPTVATDLTSRRQVTIARGLNLLSLNRDKEAAALFEKEIVQEPEGAGTDLLYLGMVNSHLQGGRKKEAEAALKLLEKGYPQSPYAARARQNFQRVK